MASCNQRLLIPILSSVFTYFPSLPAPISPRLQTHPSTGCEERQLIVLESNILGSSPRLVRLFELQFLHMQNVIAAWLLKDLLC